MVRLKAYIDSADAFVYEFQFQYGSIKSLFVQYIRTQKIDFNSNMVRLKVQFAIAICTRLAIFQFQYGSIKRGITYN